jgi:hypothetical protein
MVSGPKLADDIFTITGARFKMDHGVLTAPEAPLSTAQITLLDRLCQKTDLKLTIADPSYVVLDDVDDVMAERVALMAGDEPARIVRLEKNKAILEERTGLHFTFDRDHKILLAPGNEAPHSMVELSRKDAIEYTYLLDGEDAIAILDVDAEKLSQRQQEGSKHSIKPGNPWSNKNSPGLN